MSRTLVVVPCYNEAERMDRSAFVDFAGAHPDIHFLTVNDGSRDRTGELLEELAAAHPTSFTALQLAQNSGKAEAVRQGVVHALEQMSPDFVAYWDADLATPLDAILDFRSVLEKRGEIVLVMGSRIALMGRAIERQTTRHYLGRISATLASIALRLRVYDTQCGAKMFRATEEVRAVFSEKFATRWIFDIEILARMINWRKRSGAPQIEQAIVEYPLMQWRDVRGSNIKARDYLRSFRELFTIRRRYLK